VAASSTESRVSAVESSGSLNHPSVLNAEAAPRLEGLVLDQVMAGIPESNFAPILNAAFCAIWKTPASDTWRHSASAVVLTVKGKGTKMDMRDGEISSEELSSVLIPGDQLAG